MNRKQTGFTIIELIVVIALLGILSAVALPRFISVTDDAHTAAVSGAGAGFATGIALIRAQAIAEGVTDAKVIGFGDGSLFVNASGAPMSTVDENTLNCVQVWEKLLQSNAPTVSTASGSDYTVGNNATNPCEYVYKKADRGTDRKIVYDTDTRAVTVTAAAP